MESEGKQTQRKQPRRRRLAGALALIFAVGWLGPLAYIGFLERPAPGAGPYLNHLSRVSCLFPRRVQTWDDWFFEVRLEGGDVTDWIEVPDSDLGSMRPFGEGTRLYRVLATEVRDRNREMILESLAAFVKERYEELHSESDSGPVAEVRFVRVRYPVGSPELVETGRGWRIPKLEEVAEERRVVVKQYSVGTKESRHSGTEAVGGTEEEEGEE